MRELVTLYRWGPLGGIVRIDLVPSLAEAALKEDWRESPTVAVLDYLRRANDDFKRYSDLALYWKREGDIAYATFIKLMTKGSEHVEGTRSGVAGEADGAQGREGEANGTKDQTQPEPQANLSREDAGEDHGRAGPDELGG